MAPSPWLLVSKRRFTQSEALDLDQDSSGTGRKKRPTSRKIKMTARKKAVKMVARRKRWPKVVSLSPSS